MLTKSNVNKKLPLTLFSTVLNFIETSHDLIQIFSVQIFPAMAEEDLQNFTYKFR